MIHSTATAKNFAYSSGKPITKNEFSQIPPDFVVNSQHIDIADVILWLALPPHFVYPRKIEGSAASHPLRQLSTTKSDGMWNFYDASMAMVPGTAAGPGAQPAGQACPDHDVLCERPDWQ